jgi:hypothetical protein
MDGRHFDQLTLRLAMLRAKRRGVIAALVATIPFARNGTAILAGPGCKDVGTRCKRKSDCCSNICRGRRGRKKCKSHDTGGCQAGQIEAFCGGTTVQCTTSSGLPGSCNTTSGNAGYCSREGACVSCTKDLDCQNQFGAGAACVKCATCPGGLGCASPNLLPL